ARRMDKSTNDNAWRMGWDSNPRTGCPVAGFQDRCIQPLYHPSCRGTVRRGFAPQPGILTGRGDFVGFFQSIALQVDRGQAPADRAAIEVELAADARDVG